MQQGIRLINKSTYDCCAKSILKHGENMLSAHEAVVRESGQGSRLDQVTHFLGIKNDSEGQDYFDGTNIIYAALCHFGVEDTQPQSQPATVSDNTATVIDTASIVRQTMRRALNLPVNMCDTVKHRDMFYVQTGWYPEPEAQDRFHAVPILELLSIPTLPSDEFHKQKESLRNIFEECIGGIISHPIALRFVVNHRGNGIERPFSRPQTDETVRSYALASTRLVMFVWKLSVRGVSEIAVEKNVSEAVATIFNQEPSKHAVFHLMHLLLAEMDSSSDDSCALMALFIRFSCQSRTHGSLLPPDDVSRLCAKLVYLMKLSVLELVSVEISEVARVEKMRILLPLVEVNNFNVFSLVCRLQGLAKNSDATQSRLPIIASMGDNGTEIVFRGTKLHASDISLEYGVALERCKSIMKKLLLGLNGITNTDHVVDNFADNSAGYQIMSNQEPCKDEAVRSHLLSHIYSNQELKKRFIYGLGSGEAIFNVDAAREYVALYDDKTRSTSGRTKVICRFLDEEASLLFLTDLFMMSFYQSMKQMPYSLSVDGSNDTGLSKMNPLTFLDLCLTTGTNSSKASDIFDAINCVVEKNDIPWDLDNTNTNVGAKNSIKSREKNECFLEFTKSEEMTEPGSGHGSGGGGTGTNTVAVLLLLLLLLLAVRAALLLVAVRAALLLVAVRAALLLVAVGAALLLLAADGRDLVTCIYQV
eukprot:Em0008g39a